MFCRNCGKELTGTPAYCPQCGAKPLLATGFCFNCGAATTPATEICVKCGARVGGTPVATQQGKSKTASILLAVFLGFWTWLYTYKKDAWKFWVGLGLAILIIISAIVTFGFSALFTWLISLGIWIWSIVDVCVKDNNWYSSY
jgi:uncharacterized membrane protein YvbJ